MSPNSALEFGNEAGWDRALRIILGVGMIAVGWSEILPPPGSAALKIFGWEPLLTGIAGWSPLYALLGLDSRRWFRGARDPKSHARRRIG